MDLTGVRILTPRLCLRAVAPGDRDAIFREFRDEITRYMGVPTPRDPSETDAFIGKAREGMRSGEELQCTILEQGRFAGCGGVHDLAGPAPELGIWITRDLQGAGFGREAVEALLTWACTHRPRAPFLRYPVDRANTPSRRIAEALGGTPESTYTRETEDGRTLDIVEYHIPAARSGQGA